MIMVKNNVNGNGKRFVDVRMQNKQYLGDRNARMNETTNNE